MALNGISTQTLKRTRQDKKLEIAGAKRQGKTVTAASQNYSISGSEVSISGSGTLTFVSAPDYETKNSYTATVTVSDGTDSVTQSITVTVTDVDETVPNQAPTISSSASFSASANASRRPCLPCSKAVLSPSLKAWNSAASAARAAANASLASPIF